jgi:hypothetical protein
MGEMPAAGITEQAETRETQAVARLDLGDHGEQDLVIADRAFAHVFEAVAIVVAEHPDREQRRQHDAVVPAAEILEGVAIAGEAPPGAVHRDDQLGRLARFAQRLGHIEAVAEARIGLAGDHRRRAEIVERAGDGGGILGGSGCGLGSGHACTS